MWKKRNEQLTDENLDEKKNSAEFSMRVDELEEQLAIMRGENERLQTFIEEKTSNNGEMESKNLQLSDQISELQRKNTLLQHTIEDQQDDLSTKLSLIHI